MVKKTVNINGSGRHPLLRVVAMLPSMSRGDTLEVVGVGQEFETDIRHWCKKMAKTLESAKHQSDGNVTCRIVF